jgi:hypothetical protein
MSHNKGQRVLISGSIATYWTGPTTISVLVHVGEYLVARQDDVVRLGLDEARNKRADAYGVWDLRASSSGGRK